MCGCNKEKLIIEKYLRFEAGKLFCNLDFGVELKNKELKRILNKFILSGEVHTILSKVYYKVERNKLSQFKNKPLSPDIAAVLQTLSRATALRFQEHGGIAANRLGLSMQVPLIHVFYTTGRSREIKLYGQTIRLIRTRCLDVFQYAHEPAGWAISALYFFGPQIVDPAVIEKLKDSLGEEDFQKFLEAKKSGWMKNLILEVEKTAL
ncbi:DUF6088 family protein [Acinetobacter sp. YH12233]|uniref:DUF6088 family protein n=1 Tax=Acinetobacter sp. YH12233 TaxID=2601161 RepID=UPI0015D15323|nr:DUF6088 family protein [Acinetobacter sp. YH12233]